MDTDTVFYCDYLFLIAKESTNLQGVNNLLKILIQQAI